MPIDPTRYHPKWKLISYLIRKVRAKDRCEDCSIPNRSVVKRLKDGSFRPPSYQEWDMIFTRIKYSHSSLGESIKFHGFTRVVLTVAHLDHDVHNNRFWNLKAKCQRCHLKHDKGRHIENRKYGRYYRDDQYDLFI